MTSKLKLLKILLGNFFTEWNTTNEYYKHWVNLEFLQVLQFLMLNFINNKFMLN